jgi:multiple sugar transport system permease protein
MLMRVVTCAVIGVGLTVVLLPLVVMLMTSLKSKDELFLGGLALFPANPQLGNYPSAVMAANWPRYFLNSAVVTVITVVGSVFLNLLAGFAFARLRFAGRDTLFFGMLVGIMIPAQAIVIPQFLIMRGVPLMGGNDIVGQGGAGWLDTYMALIVPWLAGSFGVFLARQYYLNFPRDLDDAARIDGCGSLRTFVAIYLPLSGPLIGALAILKGTFMWNDFFYPLVMTQSPDMRTVQLGLQTFAGDLFADWHLMMAAALLVSLPVVVLFVLLQRWFVEGVVTSGLKG